ncbi:hypothetical protein Golax_009259, partial [Gossypium laxum]|nr:hypothetical protein [Gossypium laxum]
MTARNLTTDQFALLEFKDRIVDPHNVLENNWTASSSVCRWIGVSCGIIHERVVALNLTNMNLRGTIPPHLGNLSFLLSLDLSSNNFYAICLKNWANTIHQTLVNMSNLEILNLEFNQLPVQVPSSIFNISSLKAIDLSSNSLSGSLSDDMCQHLPKLEGLHLSVNELS